MLKATGGDPAAARAHLPGRAAKGLDRALSHIHLEDVTELRDALSG